MLGIQQRTAEVCTSRRFLHLCQHRGVAQSCGVKTDGSVACWGLDNRDGQSTPPAGSFVSVSAGGSEHSCGVKTDGSVACWGAERERRWRLYWPVHSAHRFICILSQRRGIAQLRCEDRRLGRMLGIQRGRSWLLRRPIHALQMVSFSIRQRRHVSTAAESGQMAPSYAGVITPRRPVHGTSSRLFRFSKRRGTFHSCGVSDRSAPSYAGGTTPKGSPRHTEVHLLIHSFQSALVANTPVG